MTTFVVRVSTDEGGDVVGVVEQVRNGHKARFRGVDAISAVIARMLAGGPESSEGE